MKNIQFGNNMHETLNIDVLDYIYVMSKHYFSLNNLVWVFPNRLILFLM